MSIRLFAGLTAGALLVGPALANDKKKAPLTPETAPAPVVLPAPILTPSPAPVPVPTPATLWYPQVPAPLLPPPRAIEPASAKTPPLAPGTTRPSPRYPVNPLPQYLPAEPQFPLPREFASQVEAAEVRATKATPTGQPMARTYGVGDLIIPLPKAGEQAPTPPKTLEAQLIKSITAAVSPKSWKANGGAATLEYFPLGLALVVYATPDVHEALEKYLDGVRQMNDLQIVIDVTVARISTDGLERSGLAKDFLPSKDKPHEIRTRTRFFSQDDLAAFRLCKDELTEITRPKLTILNGQEGCVKVCSVEHFLTGVTVQSVNDAIIFVPRNEPQETGIEVKIEGNVAGDKRFVKLAVNARARDVSVRPVAQIPVTVPLPGVQADGKPAEKAPFTQFIEDPKFVTRSVNETVTVPDGGTVVFYGGKADFERKVREKLPMLADVPVLAELFAKDKKETASDHLLIFATTRILNPQAGTEECDVPCCATNDRLGKLMAEYAHACKAGKSAEALKLAVECLSIDPTCFGKK